MSPKSAKRPATYQDLLALPEHLVAEIVDGELVATPRPAGPHTKVTSVLGVVLGPMWQGLGGPGGWLILDEPELHFGDDVLVPDLGGWRTDRMPDVPDEPFFTLAPDWVCKVLSPSTGVLDRKRKLPIYLREGVGHVWLVDPQKKCSRCCGMRGGTGRSSGRTRKRSGCGRSPSRRWSST
ncbi:MAG TPA: Uma2 family endonuclease [Polyangia bacterium]|jgi:Uma2 family endonuclease|nr:Uma2 family endonuclease [Polyangia bacterium]